MTETLNYKKEFTDFLQNRTKSEVLKNGVVRLTTPLLDVENDSIELYITRNNGLIEISDDGETIRNLNFSGFTFDKKPFREKLLQNIVSNHGVQIGMNNELLVKATESTTASRMYMLTQCMQKVSDLFFLNRSNVKNLFTEDVKFFLEENRIRFIQDVSFAGRSGLNTVYDFAIPASDRAPERIVQSINSLQIQQAKTILFGWEDTRDNRKRKNSSLYVIYNDENTVPSAESLSALREYNVIPLAWTGKEQFVSELSA